MSDVIEVKSVDDYKSEIESWDWKAIIKEANDYRYKEDGNVIGCVLLGSVLSLAPSGKYYMPFACSNLDVCTDCKGEGCEQCGHTGSKEAFEDKKYYEVLENFVSLHNGFLFSGEGDACDLFFGLNIEDDSLPCLKCDKQHCDNTEMIECQILKHTKDEIEDDDIPNIIQALKTKITDVCNKCLWQDRCNEEFMCNAFQDKLELTYFEKIIN